MKRGDALWKGRGKTTVKISRAASLPTSLDLICVSCDLLLCNLRAFHTWKFRTKVHVFVTFYAIHTLHCWRHKAASSPVKTAVKYFVSPLIFASLPLLSLLLLFNAVSTSCNWSISQKYPQKKAKNELWFSLIRTENTSFGRTEIWSIGPDLVVLAQTELKSQKFETKQLD